MRGRAVLELEAKGSGNDPDLSLFTMLVFVHRAYSAIPWIFEYCTNTLFLFVGGLGAPFKVARLPGVLAWAGGQEPVKVSLRACP